MKVSFSLGGKAKPVPVQAPSLKQPVAFGTLEDDPIDAAPTASSSRNGVQVNKTLAAQAVASSEGAGLSRAMKKSIEEQQRIDSTVYEYDEVYDRMQEAKAKQKAAKEAESQERKPKYIGAFLQSAQTRKLDRLRAEEKMLQREREAEGDEFADKDQFVTQAYKDQMEEVRRAEEEEKKREEMEKSKKKIGTGMTHFYRQLLEQTDLEHNAAVAATSEQASEAVSSSPTSKRKFGPSVPGVVEPTGPNLTISRPPEIGSLSDLEKARIAMAEGKNVELNDDNQIVDHTDLLSAGLNLSAPNTRRLGFNSNKRKAGDDGQSDRVESHRAVGTAASRKEIQARREREIEVQRIEELQRAESEARRLEEERVSRVVQKRNTEDDVQSARARYLERKRRKLEEVNLSTESEGVGEG